MHICDPCAFCNDFVIASAELVPCIWPCCVDRQPATYNRSAPMTCPLLCRRLTRALLTIVCAQVSRNFFHGVPPQQKLSAACLFCCTVTTLWACSGACDLPTTVRDFRTYVSSEQEHTNIFIVINYGQQYQQAGKERRRVRWSVVTPASLTTTILQRSDSHNDARSVQITKEVFQGKYRLTSLSMKQHAMRTVLLVQY